MTAPLPMDRSGYDEAARMAKESLAEAAFMMAWESGSGLALDDAVEVALALATIPGAHGNPAKDN